MMLTAETTPGNGRSAARGGSLVTRLLSQGCQFDFFQAVWLLERQPDAGIPVGGRGPAAQETLRFRPAVSLGFPSTDVRSVAACAGPDGKVYHRIEVTFLGLYGVATPLPLHYAVSILRSVESAGTTTPSSDAAVDPNPPAATPVRDFLDLLHHRLVSLFYRAWTKYRYHVTFGMPGRDVLTDYLGLLAGTQTSWDERVLGLSPLRLIRYAGTLTQRPRSAAALEGLLLDYWKGLPVRITQGIGRWITLKPTDLNRIGALNSRLGEDLTVGEQVYDLSGAFRVSFGPMDWATYVSFLPDTPRFGQTRAFVRLYCMDPLAFSIELKLRPGEVPETLLSSDDSSSRLGFSSWVRTGPMPETAVTFDVNF